MEAFPPGVYALASILSFILACGLIAWVIRAASRGRKTARSSSSPKSPPAPVGTDVVAAQQSQPPHDSQTSPPSSPEPISREELLSVARTAEGEMLVLARGQPFRRLRDINDPRLGQDTIEAINTVLVFAEGWIPFIQKWSAESATARPVPPAQQPGTQPPSPMVAPQPSRSPSPSSTTTIPKPGSLLEPLPLVGEINDLVQKRLRENPELSQHLITLTTAIDGSLRIYVDHQAFQNVDAISNPGVRNLIRSAIQEWEGR
jgi:hypothetical protein